MKTKNFYGAVITLATAAMMLSCGKSAPATEAAAPSTDHVNMMLKDWERAKKFTMAYIDSSNDKSVTYKLSDKTPRTFGEQLLHLSEANYGLGQVATGQPTEMGFGKLEKNDQIKTKADLTKAVMDSYDYVINGLKGMNDKQLMDTCSVQLGPNFKPTMTKGEMLNKLFEHQTHHRGQATQYLRAQGLTPPQEMLF
jgi:uncharacterized damage-inducible protein DinB